MKYCCLLFDGLVQSYGYSNSFTSVHNTNEFPTRSSISGMICRGLGRYGTQIEFLNKLKEDLKINVYGFNDKSCHLNDFQTIGTSSINYYDKFCFNKNKKLIDSNEMKLVSYTNSNRGNLIVNKIYLNNSKFGVVLYSENKELFEEVVQAFEKPINTLYYGRKNCPVSGKILLGIFEDLNSCLNNYNNIGKIQYEITEQDNNSDLEFWLNDIPIQFGDEKIYQLRCLYKKFY